MEAFLEVLPAAATAKILLSYRNTICIMLGQLIKTFVLQVHIHITRPHTSLLFTKIFNTCLCKAQLPEVIT